MKGKISVALLLLVVMFGASVALNFYLYRESTGEGEYAREKARREAASDFEHGVLAEATQIWADSMEVYQNNWFGIRTLQNPMDAWVTQEIMFEVKPDFIIECGTFKGGSAVLWASMLMHINPDGRVITIDIEDQRVKEALDHPLTKERVDFILGGSTDPATVEQVASMVEGKRVLVILDSLHTKEHVADELRLYSPFVQDGSYIIVQDTAGILKDKYPGLSWEACLEFEANSKGDWEIDRTRERNMMSTNFDGYLKRLRNGPAVAPSPSGGGAPATDDESTTGSAGSEAAAAAASEETASE